MLGPVEYKPRAPYLPIVCLEGVLAHEEVWEPLLPTSFLGGIYVSGDTIDHTLNNQISIFVFEPRIGWPLVTIKLCDAREF